MNRFCLCGLLLGLVVLGMDRSSRAQVKPFYFEDAQPAVPPPASLGQQPFSKEKEPDLTPSQTNNMQLNQLFQFETTPDTCAAGEGYLTAEFNYTKFSGNTKTYRYMLQGQYAITDQIAVGAYIPVITSHITTNNTGMGDVGIYGQYKLDQLINPEIVDVTGQVDVILPTGNRTELRDTGKFGVRPLILAYKDFGQYGPGDFGLYGLFGFTLTTNTDVRVGIAATYQYQNLVGIVELYDISGVKRKPLLEVTPGLSYRGLSPWEISIGAPVGINKGTPDWGVIFKLTYVFQN
jgi:hypothetical protein